MEDTMSASEPQRDVTPESSHMEVMVVYEDLPSGVRAKCMVDQLLERAQLSRGMQVRLHLWKIDMLRIPPLEEQAVRDAAGANMVILSMPGRDDLATPARQLIRDWGNQKKDQACALVVLLDENQKGSRACQRLLGYLNEFARELKIDFFAEFVGAPPSLLRKSIDQIKHRAESPSQLLESMLRRDLPQRRWGINE